MKTFVVEAKNITKRDDLDDEDSKSLWEITTPRRIEAESADAALDEFHRTVPISCLEDFDIEVREGMPLRRFYVTMTWDDWPEGGSFGTVVEAEGHKEAECLCRREMAAHRGEDSEDEEFDAFHYLEDYGDEWEVVDCFDLDKFIAMHTKKPKPDPEKVAALVKWATERPDWIDDLVHECKASEAAEVNNGGAESQIDYLIEAYGLEGLEAITQECAA